MKINTNKLPCRFLRSFQDIADQKYADALYKEADFSILINCFYDDNGRFSGHSLEDYLQELMSGLIQLGMKANSRRVPCPIYGVTTKSAFGEDYYFFVGDYQEVRARLQKLESF